MTTNSLVPFRSFPCSLVGEWEESKRHTLNGNRNGNDTHTHVQETDGIKL